MKISFTSCFEIYKIYLFIYICLHALIVHENLEEDLTEYFFLSGLHVFFELLCMVYQCRYMIL